jgi:type IX secretion system PorP/SprF family membrane protein
MMKKPHAILLVILCFFLLESIQAQQFPMSNHYLFNTYSLSPAFAGSNGSGDFYLNYRKDWLNFDPAPETYRFNTSFHIGNSMYIGAEAFKDQVDIFERFKGTLSYTYRLQMANEQYLHFGLWGNVFQNTINVGAIHGNPDDPLIRNLDQLSKMTYNAGFSLIYINRAFYVGFGMPTLIRTKDAYLMQSQGNFAFEQEYQFHISNTFDLSSSLQFMPFVVVRRTSNQPTIIDVSGSFIFGEKFWISGLYRNSQVVALGVGGELFNTMNLHYSYELGIGGIHYRSGGSHEITLGFRFGKYSSGDVKEYKQPKQQKQKNRRYMLHDYQQLYEQKYRRD